MDPVRRARRECHVNRPTGQHSNLYSALPVCPLWSGARGKRQLSVKVHEFELRFPDYHIVNTSPNPFYLELMREGGCYSVWRAALSKY